MDDPKRHRFLSKRALHSVLLLSIIWQIVPLIIVEIGGGRYDPLSYGGFDWIQAVMVFMGIVRGCVFRLFVISVTHNSNP